MILAKIWLARDKIYVVVRIISGVSMNGVYSRELVAPEN